MAPRKPSRTLAKVHEQHQPNPLLVDQAEHIKVADGLTDFDLHNGILDHLGFDRLLGSAAEAIMDARKLTGDARRTLIRRAIAYLQRADHQAGITALAVCVAPPAWLAVVARCAGLLS